MVKAIVVYTILMTVQRKVKSIIKVMLTLLVIRCRYAFKSTADTVIGIHIVLWETIMQQFFQSGATKIEE